MLVGTHADLVPKEQFSEISIKLEKLYNAWSLASKTQKFLKIIYNQHSKLFFWPVALSPKDANSVQALSSTIVTYIETRMAKQHIPSSYLALLKQISDLRTNNAYLEWHKFVDICDSTLNGEASRSLDEQSRQRQLYEQATTVAKYFHEWGELLYYPNDVCLKEYVIIDARFLIRLFKTVISFRYLQKGTPASQNPLISENELFSRWRNELNIEDTDFQMMLLRLLRDHFQIIAPWKTKYNYIIPSQFFPLDNEENDIDIPMQHWNSLFPVNATPQQSMIRSYPLTCIPEGFLSRLFIIMNELATQNYSEMEIDPMRIWPRGFILTKNSSNKMRCANDEDTKIMFSVQQSSKQNINWELCVWCYPAGSSNQLFISKLFLSIQNLLQTWYPYIWKQQRKIEVGLMSKEPQQSTWIPFRFPYSSCITSLLQGNDFIQLDNDKQYSIYNFIPEYQVHSHQFNEATHSLTPKSEDEIKNILLKQDKESIHKTEVYGNYYKTSADNDKFDLTFVRYLAEGSFGKVYEGIWKGKYHIAIKEAKADSLDGSEEQVSSVLAEVSMHKMLHHQNIVRLLFYYFKPNPIIGLEYLVNCKDLETYLKGNTQDRKILIKKSQNLLNKEKWGSSPFRSWLIIIKIALDIANGMAYLHSLSPVILHNDLRPPNILILNLNPDSSVVSAKVTDMGNSILCNASHKRQTAYAKATDIGAFGGILQLFLPFDEELGKPPADFVHIIELTEEQHGEWMTFSYIANNLQKIYESIRTADDFSSDTLKDILNHMLKKIIMINYSPS